MGAYDKHVYLSVVKVRVRTYPQSVALHFRLIYFQLTQMHLFVLAQRLTLLVVFDGIESLFYLLMLHASLK